MARKALIAQALSRFIGRLIERYPGFREVKSAAPSVQALRFRIVDKTAIFVIWRFHDRDDCFTLEIGWSSKDRCPGGPDQTAFYPRQNPQPVGGGLLFRVGWFLDPPRDYWWDITTGKEFHLQPRPWRLELQQPASEAPQVLKPGGALDKALDDAMALLEKGMQYVERRAVEGLPEDVTQSIQPPASKAEPVRKPTLSGSEKRAKGTGTEKRAARDTAPAKKPHTRGAR
jgi:hypothetical protein